MKKLLYAFTHRRYKNLDDFYRKRTRWGEINEFFKRMLISSDRSKYTLPLLSNPRRETIEKERWVGNDSLFYEYEEPERRAVAMKRFEFMFDLVKDRIAKDDTILDCGCNTGFFLEQWHKRGYTDLHGLDPQHSAVEYANEHRPYITMREGFFGPKENDIPCDLMVWFGAISRVPYRDRLFDAIDRSARKYVLIWVQESFDDFQRDLHVGMAKKGFICIEKKVVNADYIPIGLPGADGPLFDFDDPDLEPGFHSHFLFRRIEPRPKPNNKQ